MRQIIWDTSPGKQLHQGEGPEQRQLEVGLAPPCSTESCSPVVLHRGPGGSKLTWAALVWKWTGKQADPSMSLCPRLRAMRWNTREKHTWFLRLFNIS